MNEHEQMNICFMSETVSALIYLALPITPNTELHRFLGWLKIRGILTAMNDTKIFKCSRQTKHERPSCSSLCSRQDLLGLGASESGHLYGDYYLFSSVLIYPSRFCLLPQSLYIPKVWLCEQEQHHRVGINISCLLIYNYDFVIDIFKRNAIFVSI